MAISLTGFFGSVSDLVRGLLLVTKKLGKVQEFMAKLDDQLAALKADLDQVKTDLTSIVAGISSLNQTIQDLKDQLATAGLTADQQAALDAAVTEADELKASADSVVSGLNPPPPTPAA